MELNEEYVNFFYGLQKFRMLIPSWLCAKSRFCQISGEVGIMPQLVPQIFAEFLLAEYMFTALYFQSNTCYILACRILPQHEADQAYPKFNMPSIMETCSCQMHSSSSFSSHFFFS